MRKKRRVLLAGSALVVFVIILMAALGTAEKKNNVTGGDNVIKILMPYVNKDDVFVFEKGYFGMDAVENYVDAYNLVNDDGYKVEIVMIGTADYNKYYSEKNSMLMSDDPPDLFFISAVNFENLKAFDKISNYVDSGLALDISDRLDNYDHLYEIYQNEYFLPIGALATTTPYFTKALKEIDITELPTEMKIEDKIDIVRKWMLKTNPEYDYVIYDLLIDTFFHVNTFYDFENKAFDFDVDDFMDRINEVKGFIEDGVLFIPEHITYEEIMEHKSDPPREMRHNSYKQLEEGYYPIYSFWEPNILNGGHIHINEDYLFSADNSIYETIGFVVNKNGRDLEGALRFLDYVICDSTQLNNMETSMSGRYTAPINKSIKEEMKDLELKKWGFQMIGQKYREDYMRGIEEGKYVQADDSFILIQEFINEVMFKVEKYILTDDIDERELASDIKKLKNMYIFRILE